MGQKGTCPGSLLSKAMIVATIAKYVMTGGLIYSPVSSLSLRGGHLMVGSSDMPQSYFLPYLDRRALI